MFIKSSVNVNISRDATRFKKVPNASLLVFNFILIHIYFILFLVILHGKNSFAEVFKNLSVKRLNVSDDNAARTLIF